MKRRIFWAIVLVSFASVLVYSALMLRVAHDRQLDALLERLDVEARFLALGVAREGTAYFRHASPACRVSLIAPDGQVFYDSSGLDDLPNHADRQEVREALERGAGGDVRFSDTLGQRTIYRSLRLRNGDILRLALTESSLWRVLWGMLLASGLALALSMLLAAWLAGRLARHVVRPIDAIDLDHPQHAENYEELAPLLRRLARQKAQLAAQLRELERRQREFEAVTANMAEGLVLLDANGRVLSRNTVAPRLLGLDCLPTGSVLLRLDRDERLRRAVDNAVTHGTGQTLLHRRGRWVQVYVNATRDAAGSAPGCVLLCLDVTEREEREALRREFSANVSHELKTPLTSISGIAEIMKNGLIAPDDVTRFATIIYDEAHRLLQLITNILQLSQLDEAASSGLTETNERPVDLLALSCTCLARLEALARQNSLSLGAEGEAAQVRGHPSLLEQMLFNLCENAVKYNRVNGTVRVRVTNQPCGAVTVEVSDTGAGIPADLRHRVFERFFRADKSRSRQIQGTGLGLSIVRHIAELHQARVELESEEGKGTTVRVTFPAARAQQT